MTGEHKEPRIRHGIAWAIAYTAFCVALYSLVVWGWPWVKVAMPAKFWAVF